MTATEREALVKALRALAEGYFFETKDDRFIIIDNPAFQEDDGSAPKLVIDVFDLPAISPAVTVTEEAKQIVDEQADDWGLWCVPASIVEDVLQKALRRLHAAVEGKTPEQCALAALKSPTPQTGSQK